MLKRMRDEPCDGSARRVLHSYWRSSSAWRVRLALEYKKLPYEYYAVNLLLNEESDPKYLALNPTGGLPTLQDEGHVIPQSMAILEYLEERYPQISLLPRSFADRATVRGIALIIVSGIQPLQNNVVLAAIEQKYKGDKNEWAKQVIGDGLAAVEASIAPIASSFSMGSLPTMIDCCLVPQVYNAVRFGVDMTMFPTINGVVGRLEQLDWVKAAHPDQMPDAPRKS